MIEILMFEGQYCPVLVCFVCGERIDADNPGNVNWSPEPPYKLYATHKGPKHRCQRAFDKAMEPVSLPWEDAQAFLAQAVLNFENPIKEER